MSRIARIAAAVTLAALALTGCSQMSTEPDQVGLHYKGGPLSSTKFSDCIEPGKRAVDGPSDPHYAYPAGQRTYRFTAEKGADTGPIKAATSDNIELTTSGFVTFTLDVSCTPATINGRKYEGGTLQYFHESIGLKNWAGHHAYIEGDDEDSYTGWSTMLDTYIGQPLQRAVNDASQGRQWKPLYNDPKTKTEWEQQVLTLLPTYIRQAAGADFFKIASVTIQKPVPPENIVAGLAASETARLENAAQSQRNAKTVTELEGIRKQIAVMGRETWLQKYAIDSGKVTVLPIPAGSNVSVNGGGK